MPHLTYTETQIGTGEAAAIGKVMTFAYVALKEDGSKDVEWTANDPAIYLSGDHRMAPWGTDFFDEAFTDMRVGGRRHVVVPQPAKDDKPVAPVTFDMQLLAINDAPTIWPTLGFMEVLLRAHGRKDIASNDNQHFISFLVTDASSTGWGCKWSIKRTVVDDGEEHKYSTEYNLSEFDPGMVRVTSRSMGEGWHDISSASFVSALSSRGSDHLGVDIDNEEDAQRFAKALTHAILLCGGRKGLF